MVYVNQHVPHMFRVWGGLISVLECNVVTHGMSTGTEKVCV